MHQPWVFSSILLVGNISANFPEEVAHFPNEQVGLLERREMAALRHLAPVGDVGIARFHPLAHRRYDLLREHRHSRRYFYGVRRSPFWSEALPIQTRRRRSARRDPIEH